MKFTLKDYQEEAVQKVLVNLKNASRRWREDGDKHAFSLTATTGAGKTVMAAAALEALFHGDDNYDIEPACAAAMTAVVTGRTSTRTPRGRSSQ
jgi:type II secretory pathway predicted ATPase ExeA